MKLSKICVLKGLENIACYAGQLIGGLWPSAEAKKGLVMLVLPILGHFWWSVVTSVNFSNNLYNKK